ncbi:MAG: hypothetical protein ACE5DX_01060 [Candidatus Dojkabacteria bacterium]
MASQLTRSTSLARKAVIGFIVFAIFTFICQFILDLVDEGIKTTPTPSDPAAYLKVDNALGDIPRPVITSLTLESGTQASYALDEAGRLPDSPPVINVYEILEPRETFGSTQRGRSMAEVLGFPRQETRLADDILFWENRTLTRSLSYHKVLQEWNYDVTIATDSATSQFVPLKSEQGFYTSKASGLLSNLGISNANFSNKFNRVDFINFSNGVMSRVLDPEDGRYARISLYKSVESSTLAPNYKPDREDESPPETVVSEVRKYDFLSGPANFIVQGTAETPSTDYVHLDFKDYTYGESGVYQLISPQQAWLDIQANLGYLIWLRPEDIDVFGEFGQYRVVEFNVLVDSVRVIYIEPDEWKTREPWTHYLQPFYMFEGFATLDDGRQAEFAFIVNALSPDSYLASTE